jgi:hypothetical protein
MMREEFDRKRGRKPSWQRVREIIMRFWVWTEECGRSRFEKSIPYPGQKISSRHVIRVMRRQKRNLKKRSEAYSVLSDPEKTEDSTISSAMQPLKEEPEEAAGFGGFDFSGAGYGRYFRRHFRRYFRRRKKPQQPV